MITDKQINEFLNQYHISHRYLGYNYLMIGISMMLKEDVPRGRVCEAYRQIAQKYNSQPRSVERAIRRTIDEANIGMSNKEFMTLAVDELMYQNVD